MPGVGTFFEMPTAIFSGQTYGTGARSGPVDRVVMDTGLVVDDKIGYDAVRSRTGTVDAAEGNDRDGITLAGLTLGRQG